MARDWADVLDLFADYQRVSGLSERTIKARREVLEMLARNSGKPPILIDHHDLIAHLNRPHSRHGGPLSAGTKQVERSYLQTWGRWMMDEGLKAFDPAARLPRVKVPRRIARPLNLSHIHELLSSGIYRPTIEKIIIGANSGLRLGEIVAIHEDHYDWTTDQIYTVRKGGLVMWMPVPDIVREIAEQKRGQGWWFPSSYRNVQFPDGGGHVLMKSASTRISAALRRIGIIDPRITGHSLRHFYCCMLIAIGVPIHIIQQLMGHASLATTQLYFNVSETELLEAVRGIPRIGLPSSNGSELPPALDDLAAPLLRSSNKHLSRRLVSDRESRLAS